MALNIDSAEKDLRGAVRFLAVYAGENRVGVIGFCMGGQLALFAACASREVAACVNFYRIHPNVQPVLANLNAPVLGFFSERDEHVPPASAIQLKSDLQVVGKKADVTVLEGTEHAFFNDTRPEVYHEKYAFECWERTLTFFHEYL